MLRENHYSAPTSVPRLNQTGLSDIFLFVFLIFQVRIWWKNSYFPTNFSLILLILARCSCCCCYRDSLCYLECYQYPYSANLVLILGFWNPSHHSPSPFSTFVDLANSQYPWIMPEVQTIISQMHPLWVASAGLWTPCLI